MTQSILLVIGLTAAASMAIALYWNNIALRLFVLTTYAILASAVYFSLDGVKGWPAEEKKEVSGMLATVVILNPSENSEGAIIISLFPSGDSQWYEYQYHRYAPKTFYLKYSNDRAAQFEAAKQALMEGKQVRINSIPSEHSSDGEEGNENSIQTVTDIISEYMSRMMSNQEDTYQPDNPPDVEILSPVTPPQKGSDQ